MLLFHKVDISVCTIRGVSVLFVENLLCEKWYVVIKKLVCDRGVGSIFIIKVVIQDSGWVEAGAGYSHRGLTYYDASHLQ